METKPKPAPSEEQESEAAGKALQRDPKKATGSLNPKQRNAFYEAVLPKTARRDRH